LLGFSFSMTAEEDDVCREHAASNVRDVTGFIVPVTVLLLLTVESEAAAHFFSDPVQGIGPGMTKEIEVQWQVDPKIGAGASRM
jgi:hypothetical protein